MRKGETKFWRWPLFRQPVVQGLGSDQQGCTDGKSGMWLSRKMTWLMEAGGANCQAHAKTTGEDQDVILNRGLLFQEVSYHGDAVDQVEGLG